MAEVNGVNYQLSQNVPVDQVASKENFGRVRILHDTYEAAALPSGDKINIGKIPKGAKILDAKIVADALGAGVTLELGDAGDPNRLVAATVFTSAAVGQMAASEIDSGWGFIYTAETLLQLTVGVGAATGTIKTWVAYTLD